MAIVKSFKAVRPAKEYSDKVISLPYDVMNRKEAAEMAEGNPYSFLHICRSEIDLPEVEDEHTQPVYDKAAQNIKDFLDKGVFIEEDKPVIYVYREIMEGRVQTGIMACVSIDDYKNDIIKKHEFTRVEKEIDRINHFYTCNGNTEPVYLTYRDETKIRTLVEGWAENHEPEYDITTDDGIRHIIWPITDDSVVENISTLFAGVPYLYIADGHHRSASAYKVGEKKRAENPGYTGDEEFNFFMAAIFPDADLHVFDYNRVVKDLNGRTKEEFMEDLKKAGFDVEPKGKEVAKPGKKHQFGMFLDGLWYTLTAQDRLITDDVIDSLDVAILQNNVLQPILGIEDPRTDKRIDFVGGIRGMDELVKRVNEDMEVAFAVYPVEIEDLLKVADEGKVMPPKSTWFEPKLASGLLMHLY